MPLIEDIILQMLAVEYPSSLSLSIKSIISAFENESNAVFLDEKKRMKFPEIELI